MPSSLIDQMRERVQRTGGAKKGIFFVKAGEKRRVRFLVELDQGVKVVFHDKWGELNTPCLKHFGKRCPYDNATDKDIRTRDNFAWPVYNYETKSVEIFMYKANDKTPIPALLAMYEAYGTILDRDYTITRTGEKFDTSYSVVPMDKAKFSVGAKLKVPTKGQLLQMIWDAFGSEDEDVAEEGNEEEEFEEPDEEEEDE